MNVYYKKYLRSQLHKADYLKILLAAVYISMIFLPLLHMFSQMTWSDLQKVVSSANFGISIWNSIQVAGLATVITIVLAYLLAVCTERVYVQRKNLYIAFFTLPMLIPSISHGMGMVLLFGNNGILTKLLGLRGSIYGLQGIVIGSVLYAFPIAYLMLADVMRYQDSAPYEAARVLGLSTWQRFTQITIPYLRKPLISTIFAIFTLVITDYGVPLMVGGKYMTISTVMYQEVIGQLNFSKGSVYGCILLVPAIIAFFIDLFNKDQGNSNYAIKPFEPDNRLVMKIFANVFCGLTSLFAILPILSFLVLGFAKNYPYDLSFTLNNILTALDLHAGKYLWNSLIIAFCVSCVGVAFAFLTAYMSARMRSGASHFLHLSAITSTAIPGVVLGLSYVLTFKGSIFYGTILILIMVNTIHFISSPYLMMYHSLSKLNENLEGVGSTLGISRVHMILDVILPICKNTLLEMFAYFFVNCMMTISAVSFLATTANKPIALMINQFETQMQLECAAVVSLMILLSNLLVKGILNLIRRRRERA